MPQTFIYQILPYNTTRASLDPGYLVLDNTAHERSDWFEYWPIRKFLLNEPLEDESFYGFLSPKFKLKTNLSAAAAHEYVAQEAAATDVVLLSQSIHQAAYYLNTFKYGDSHHPGLLRIATQFFERIGQPTNLEALITHSGNEVYSNFIIAKPRFWRAWLAVTEQLFTIAESPADPLGIELRQATQYRGHRDVQMKVFIMERIATWILTCHPEFTVRVRDPFAARTRIYKLPVAMVCDALKLAYLSNGRKQEYKDIFHVFSKFARVFSWQIQLGNVLGVKQIRTSLKSLASHWEKAGRS